jgi:hypothetical protein
MENNNKEIIQKLVLDGDLSKMSGEQKTLYYNRFCESLGLNPLTQPFQLITFQGKQRLYATKDCTEQLRNIYFVSITDITASELRGVYIVAAKAQDKDGKQDAATGAVNIEGLKGDALANAIMKAETKAKRRVTLSICGLGMLDETETDTMKGVVTEDIKAEVVEEKKIQKRIGKAEPKSLSEDELGQWHDSLMQCDDLTQLTKLYNSNKGTVNSEPQIFKMFGQRKQQLSKPTTVN